MWFMYCRLFLFLIINFCSLHESAVSTAPTAAVKTDSNEYQQFKYALKYVSLNDSKLFYSGISTCMLKNSSNDLPWIMSCVKHVAQEVACDSFPNINATKQNEVTSYVSKNVAACTDYENRNLDCTYQVQQITDESTTAGFITLLIKQSNCNRKLSFKGGTNFDILYSPTGPPVDPAISKQGWVVAEQLSLCRVTDNFDYTYHVSCPTAELLPESDSESTSSFNLNSTTASTSGVAEVHTQQSARKRAKMSYLPCINISVSVDFEHFNAFSSCSIFGCHHSVLRRTILPFTVFCAVSPSESNSVTKSKSKTSRTLSIERSPVEEDMQLESEEVEEVDEEVSDSFYDPISRRTDGVKSKETELDPTIWNRYVTDFYDGSWVRYTPSAQPTVGAHVSSGNISSEYVWQWNDIKAPVSAYSIVRQQRDRLARHKTNRLTHRKNSNISSYVDTTDHDSSHHRHHRHPMNLYHSDRRGYRAHAMTAHDFKECLERTPMWLTGDSHLRYVWDYVVMQMRNMTGSEYMKQLDPALDDNYEDMFKHNWVTYSSQFKNVINHLIQSRGLGQLMNVTLPKQKINMVFHVGFWEIYTAPLHQYIFNPDSVPSLLASIRRLKQSPFRDNVRLIWVQTVPLPYSYCDHSIFEWCLWVQISFRNNYAIHAMNQYLEKEILKIGYPHLRIIRTHDIMYPRRQFNEEVCHNHFMCFQGDDMKSAPSGIALVQSIMRAACYY